MSEQNPKETSRARRIVESWPVWKQDIIGSLRTSSNAAPNRSDKMTEIKVNGKLVQWEKAIIYMGELAKIAYPQRVYADDVIFMCTYQNRNNGCSGILSKTGSLIVRSGLEVSIVPENGTFYKKWSWMASGDPEERITNSADLNFRDHNEGEKPYKGLTKTVVDLGMKLPESGSHQTDAQPPAQPGTSFRHMRALIVSDDLNSAISQSWVGSADIVITKKGRLLKSRWTEIPEQQEPKPKPAAEEAWYFMRRETAGEMLELLSGDLNHDNVAKAKKIIKDFLS